MNIPLIKSLNLANRRIDWLTLLRKGAWLSIVLVSILYSVVASQENLAHMQDELHRWVYVRLNFLSFVLGVLAGAIIFFRKPDSWMAFATSVMLVTFTATDNGIRFWYQLFTGVPLSVGVANDAIPFAISLFITVPYLALLTASLTYVLLTFPHEKLPKGGASWFFRALVVSQVVLMLLVGAICLFDIFFRQDARLVSDVYTLLDIFKSLLLIALAAWQIYRLRKITDPVQRQQVKWIVSSLTGMTIVYGLGMIISGIWGILVPLWLFVLGLVFTYGFIITLLIAIVRYRFWDMNFFINKALVYSAVTAVLSVFGFAGAQL
ncbi:MAG TPA: hypothetical protein VK900_18325, partial [Anaerolineales bacterium]|nr:hypothetical protein [Anaerolineales bacterium]